MANFSLPADYEVIDKQNLKLLRISIKAAERAWHEAIRPRMDAIRHGSISKDQQKAGTDFFTEADTASEKIIKKELLAHFGSDALRIFGEEENAYTGNLNADITIRIDPIDGTEAFKFGKPSWKIMIGAYRGRNKNERQIVSVSYYPEYYDEVLFFAADGAVCIGSNTTERVKEVTAIDPQDEMSNIIIACHKHSDLKERGKIDEIISALEIAGGRVKSGSPVEVKEALETGGKRAFVIDGDFNQVDFIAFSLLARLGYKVFGWDGVEYNIDDPDMAERKFALVPPGQAGEQIMQILMKIPEMND